MKKYVVCRNRIELKSGSHFSFKDEEELIEQIRIEKDMLGDSSPLWEKEFFSEKEAYDVFNEIKSHLSVQYGHYALYTLQIDEVYIEVYEVYNDGDELEFLEELDHAYGQPTYSSEV